MLTFRVLPHRNTIHLWTQIRSNCYVERFVVKRIIDQYKNIKIGCSFIVGAVCIGRRGFHVTSTCHASVNIGGVSNEPQW